MVFVSFSCEESFKTQKVEEQNQGNYLLRVNLRFEYHFLFTFQCLPLFLLTWHTYISQTIFHIKHFCLFFLKYNLLEWKWIMEEFILLLLVAQQIAFLNRHFYMKTNSVDHIILNNFNVYLIVCENRHDAWLIVAERHIKKWHLSSVLLVLNEAFTTMGLVIRLWLS